MSFCYLRIFIAFSYISRNRGAASENRTTAAGTDRYATDGELFVKRIVHGEKISVQPGYLMFTAPYFLCSGECKGSNNFAMEFPLFVGKKGRSFYQSMYPRDYTTANNKKAPFKPLQTRLPYTTCPPYKITTSQCHNSTTEETLELNDSNATSSTAFIRDTSLNSLDNLDCPKVTKCKHKKQKPRANSPFPSYRTRFAPPQYLMSRPTLSPQLQRQRAEYISRIRNYYVVTTTWLVLLILTNLIVAERLPWERWSWDAPQGPIEHYFRRQKEMPIKSPHFICECPPNKECKIDFKFNEEAVDLLSLRGVLNADEVKQFKDDMEIIKAKTSTTLLDRSARMRRLNVEGAEEQCCCPPQNAMMPTFIAERRFNNIVDDIAYKREDEPHVKPL